MSGSKKRWIYYLCDLLLYASAITAAAEIFLNTAPKPPQAADFFALSVSLLALLFNLPALVHEIGHLLFGIFAGMKLAGFHFRPISRETAGATAMFPKGRKHVRGKFITFALGGALVNLFVGGAFFALYFCLPYHPALLFLGLCAPFLIYEGLRALIPAELSAGKTDGMVLLGTIKKSPEEEIALRVLEAQGILYRGSFEEISRELLYDVPVVREDLPAFAALLFLRLQWELFRDDPAWEGTRERLNSLEEYLTASQRAEFAEFQALLEGKGEPETKKEPLNGVRELKIKLLSKAKKGDK